ncbi:MAG: U32 family peptidase, partial [Clostridia bacterium]|nr:U32 family peptidase [Clostridia bacterium]
VDKVSHRHYSTGFYYGYPGQFTEDARYLRDWKVCAVVVDCLPDGTARLSLRNKFKCGETVELVGPGLTPVSFEVPMMEDMDGSPLEEPKKPEMEFWLKLPRYAPPMSLIRRQET